MNPRSRMLWWYSPLNVLCSPCHLFAHLAFSLLTSPSLCSPRLLFAHLAFSLLTLPSLCSPCLLFAHLAFSLLTSPSLCSPCLLFAHLAFSLLTSPSLSSPCLLFAHLAFSLLTLPSLCSPCLLLAHLAFSLLTLPSLCSPCLLFAHLAFSLLTSPSLCLPRLLFAHLAFSLLTLPSLCSPCLLFAHLAFSLLTLPSLCSPCLLFAHLAFSLLTLPSLCSPCLLFAHLAFSLLTLPSLCSPCLLFAHLVFSLLTLPSLWQLPLWLSRARVSPVCTWPPTQRTSIIKESKRVQGDTRTEYTELCPMPPRLHTASPAWYSVVRVWRVNTSSQSWEKHRQPKLWVCFRWYRISLAHLNGGWHNKRLSMGKSLDRRARIFTNKMSLRRNELFYLCLVFNWAASGIISAEFARVVVFLTGANHPGKFAGLSQPLHYKVYKFPGPPFSPIRLQSRLLSGV